MCVLDAKKKRFFISFDEISCELQALNCLYIKYRDIQENEEELKESIYRRLSPI